MKTFTIEEIKNYITSKDSLGDVLYYLSEDNIEKANKKEEKITLYISVINGKVCDIFDNVEDIPSSADPYYYNFEFLKQDWEDELININNYENYII